MASSITSSDNSEGILLSASFGRVFLITFFFVLMIHSNYLKEIWSLLFLGNKLHTLLMHYKCIVGFYTVVSVEPEENTCLGI